MGYKIDYFKFIQFQADMEDLLGRMMEDLAALKDLETFMLYSQAVQCKSMACVNKYIQDKHLGIVVPAIETAVNNFMIVENAYFMEMYDIENKSGSIIEEEHLEELITTLTNLNTNITEFLKEMNDKAKAVKRIISLDTKSEEDFQDTMDALISMVSTLKTSFEEYEINKLVEANGSEWVVNGSTTAVDDVRYDDTEITEYQPEVNIEMEVPEFALRSSTFYSEFGYTEERVDNILQTKEIELELYAKAMEGQRLEQYFNNMLYAGVSMFLPFGNKIKGMKLILSEGLSLFSLTYSADRCYKGYQLLEQVELKDTETEATGLLNLENSKYGDAIIFMGEASNLYTSVAASNVVTCKIYGTPTTFASTLGDCGEEIVTSKAEDIVYNITGGNDIAATIIGGYIGNRVRRGVSLELEGIEDVIPSGKINNKTDFNNSNDFDTINSMQGYVVEDSDIDVVWREDVGEGGSKVNYNILNVSSADDVNLIFKETMGYEPPYKPGTTVTEIQLTENATYVRVYDKVNSRMQGGWVMKEEDIVGLTPQDIQNKFALPTTPKYICDVNLEAGTRLRTGEVNPLFGFEGGGQQYDLIINGKNVGKFTNERIIGQ